MVQSFVEISKDEDIAKNSQVVVCRFRPAEPHSLEYDDLIDDANNHFVRRAQENCAIQHMVRILVTLSQYVTKALSRLLQLSHTALTSSDSSVQAINSNLLVALYSGAEH